jgi:uncharacterized protein (TIGR02118 family)
MAHCLTVLYPHPDDREHFRSYYAGTHMPLARQLPGLKSCSFAYPIALGGAEDGLSSAAPFCIFQAWFESETSMGQALQSEIGGKLAADVPNYSPKGARLFHFAAEP